MRGNKIFKQEFYAPTVYADLEISLNVDELRNSILELCDVLNLVLSPREHPATGKKRGLHFYKEEVKIFWEDFHIDETGISEAKALLRTFSSLRMLEKYNHVLTRKQRRYGLA
jgi:hypothetical protein